MDGDSRISFKLPTSQLTKESDVLKQLLERGSNAEAERETGSEGPVYVIPGSLGLRLKDFELLLDVMLHAM